MKSPFELAPTLLTAVILAACGCAGAPRVPYTYPPRAGVTREQARETLRRLLVERAVDAAGNRIADVLVGPEVFGFARALEQPKVTGRIYVDFAFEYAEV